MEKFDEIYFSDHGLTSTSASHLADISQEVVAADEAMLRNMTFVTATLDIVGSASLSGKTVNIGYDDTQLGEVRRLLGEIASMNAFCAWMREAIKAKDNEIKRINAMDADDWLRANGEEPVNLYCTPRDECTDRDVMADMGIDERNRYLYLEAVASTIGKCIHPGGSFAKAREEMQDKVMRPYSTAGIGKDTLIYAYVTSVKPEAVEDVFFDLQKWNRQTEAELNRMKFAIKREVGNRRVEQLHKCREEMADKSRLRGEQEARFKEWQLAERRRVGQLKIVVPAALQETYDRLSALER